MTLQVPHPDPVARIQIATTREEQEEVYRLRYQVYVEEQGKAVACGDHAARQLHDELDAKSTLLFVRENGRVVGTVRKTWADETVVPDSFVRSYGLQQFSDIPPAAICFTSRLAVDPRFRGSKLMNSLFEFAYRISRERRTQLDFCNCAPALARVMRRLGYREYYKRFIDPEVGERIPLVGIYEDIEYLRKVSFPFLDVALGFQNSDATLKWFLARFASLAHLNAAHH